jgi:hypothetical protein
MGKRFAHQAVVSGDHAHASAIRPATVSRERSLKTVGCAIIVYTGDDLFMYGTMLRQPDRSKLPKQAHDG